MEQTYSPRDSALDWSILRHWHWLTHTARQDRQWSDRFTPFFRDRSFDRTPPYAASLSRFIQSTSSEAHCANCDYLGSGRRRGACALSASCSWLRAAGYLPCNAGRILPPIYLFRLRCSFEKICLITVILIHIHLTMVINCIVLIF